MAAKLGEANLLYATGRHHEAIARLMEVRGRFGAVAGALTASARNGKRHKGCRRRAACRGGRLACVGGQRGSPPVSQSHHQVNTTQVIRMAPNLPGPSPANPLSNPFHTQVIRMAPNLPDPYHTLGLLHEAVGDTKKVGVRGQALGPARVPWVRVARRRAARVLPPLLQLWCLCRLPPAPHQPPHPPTPGPRLFTLLRCAWRLPLVEHGPASCRAAPLPRRPSTSS